MARIKLCNKCGHRNPANRTSCEECGKDLKGKPMEEAELDRKLAEEAAKKAEEERQAAAAETAAAAAPATGGEGTLSSFRRCEECGHENPVAAINCERCGESLEGINIEFREAAAAQPAAPQHVDAVPLTGHPAPAMAPIGQRVMLTSLDNLLRHEVRGSSVLGRNHDAGVYLCRKSFVSGRHAIITSGPDGVYIEDVGSTNGTYINDSRIVSGQRFRVEHGTVIGLGGSPRLNQAEAAFLRIEIGV